MAVITFFSRNVPVSCPSAIRPQTAVAVVYFNHTETSNIQRVGKSREAHTGLHCFCGLNPKETPLVLTSLMLHAHSLSFLPSRLLSAVYWVCRRGYFLHCIRACV